MRSSLTAVGLKGHDRHHRLVWWLICHPIILQMQLSHPKPVNRCHVCGGTSYHHLVARNEHAELRSTETLVCDGCGRSFPDVKTWRDGVPATAQEQGA